MTIAHAVQIQSKTGYTRRYRVNESVYFYIRQLEAYIKSPNNSILLNRYPDRFQTTIRRLNMNACTTKHLNAVTAEYNTRFGTTVDNVDVDLFLRLSEWHGLRATDVTELHIENDDNNGDMRIISVANFEKCIVG